MFQPLEALEVLRGHCTQALNARRMAVVTLKAIGWTDKQAGAYLRLSPRAVRRHVDQARHKLFEGTDVEPTREALVAWFWCHSECCMAGALRALREGKLAKIA
jgi:DNA-binding NarL/FixJ family response regulator